MIDPVPMCQDDDVDVDVEVVVPVPVVQLSPGDRLYSVTVTLILTSLPIHSWDSETHHLNHHH